MIFAHLSSIPRTIQINLIYDPLTTTYPARLAILERIDDGDDTEEGPRVVSQRRLRSKEAVFREQRLPEAFERVLDGKAEGEGEEEEMEMEEDELV